MHNKFKEIVYLTQVVDPQQLAYCKEEVSNNCFGYMRLKLNVTIPDHKEEIVNLSPNTWIRYIERSLKPMMIEAFGFGVVKRVSDQDNGTWLRLTEHISIKGRNCCLWVESELSDEDYLINNPYYLPLVYDKDSEIGRAHTKYWRSLGEDIRAGRHILCDAYNN